MADEYSSKQDKKEAIERLAGCLKEYVNPEITPEEIREERLKKYLDPGIDDMESGRIYTYEEAREKIEEMKSIKRGM